MGESGKMKYYSVCILLIFLLAVVASGCLPGRARNGGTVSVITPDFFGIGEELATQLSINLRKDLPIDHRIILTSFVNIDDLYETSRFGRVITESLATRMFNKGYGVVEIRKMSEVMVRKKGGEITLSRDTSLLSGKHKVEAVIAGTYALTPDTVIINVRMLEAANQDVLSVAGLEMQRSYLINNLLGDTSGLTDSRLSAYEK
jgi:TolB-like protein